jgi:anti-sigma regulatory factor (Ser/Thr protein kinase)
MGSGETMVLTSDGITEAHSPEGEMYGFARLMGRVARQPSDDDMLNAVVTDLEKFTGPDAEQEDDITLVVVKRTASAQSSAATFEERRQILARFTVPSEEGNERIAIAKVTAAVDSLSIATDRLERLKTAVGETVMNAIEHGNEFRSELDVDVEVCANEDTVSVLVTDQGGTKAIPEAALPDIEAKLAGEQTPRGWGLFLIEKMVDEVKTTSDGGTHTVELVMNREGAL